MNMFDKVKFAYKNNWITKEELYQKLLDNKINIEEYQIISGEENVEFSIDYLKQKKLEKLWEDCNMSILGGFYSSVHDQEILFGFDTQDQDNITQQLVMIANGLAIEPIQWKGKGEVNFIELTVEQFKQLCVDAQKHKTNNIMRYFPLKDSVLNATTKEELESIAW